MLLPTSNSYPLTFTYSVCRCQLELAYKNQLCTCLPNSEFNDLTYVAGNKHGRNICTMKIGKCYQIYFLLDTRLFYQNTTAHSPVEDPGHLCSFKASTLILQTWPFTKFLGGSGSQTQLCIRITREEPANMCANMCYSWISFLKFKFSGSGLEPRTLYFYKIHSLPTTTTMILLEVLGY